jgi:hypothetical protein
MCHFHLQGERKAKQETSVKQVASSAEDGSDMFLKNIS